MKRHILALAALAAAGLAAPAAEAATPGYLQVRDASPKIAGFVANDVLFDPAGFPVGGLIGRPGTRYAAFGVLTDGRVAVSTSENGQTWTAPAATTLAKNNGSTGAFTVAGGRRIAVAYVPHGRLPHGNRFIIAYAPGNVDERGIGQDTVIGDPVFFPVWRVENLRYALSANGTSWSEDYDSRVANNDLEPIIDGAGANTFKEGLVGPSDLIYNPGRACYNTAVVNGIGWSAAGSPFDCEFTLVYTTIDQAGDTSIGLAGGVFFSDIGLELRASDQPALTRSQAAWASAGIDRAHALQTGSTFNLGFSGSTASQRCNGVADACAIGTAQSANGRVFTPDRPAEPSISTTVAGSIAGAAVSIHDLQPMADNTTEPHYLVSFGGGTWSAYGADQIGTAPRLIFLKPYSGYVTITDPEVSFVLNDDFGTNVGLNFGSLDVRLNGEQHVSPMAMQQTSIGSFTRPGWLLTIPTNQTSLDDGTHTLTVSVADRDGETVEGSRTFLIDRRRPTSQIVSMETSGYTFPLNSMYFTGSASDLGEPTGLQRMRGTVTNPIGQTKSYEGGYLQTGNVVSGFRYSNYGPVVANGGPRSWDYSWAVPMDDPVFWALPGIYELTIQSIDFAGNVENLSAANVRSVLLI